MWLIFNTINSSHEFWDTVAMILCCSCDAAPWAKGDALSISTANSKTERRFYNVQREVTELCVVSLFDSVWFQPPRQAADLRQQLQRATASAQEATEEQKRLRAELDKTADALEDRTRLQQRCAKYTHRVCAPRRTIVYRPLSIVFKRWQGVGTFLLAGSTDAARFVLISPLLCKATGGTAVVVELLPSGRNQRVCGTIRA